ncbi:MAG: DNA mismatch repair protein MutS [Bdellovibrionota bacterium]
MQNSTSAQASAAPGKLTPLMQQYWDVKAAHEDKVLLFRMGDFFEMFHRDAETAAPVLGIALTSRNKNAADQIPMCGVPHHSIANSINKLLANGYKVAICDQIEDPKFAKGLVKRAVTRILSPGVVYDPETLDATRPNYIASFDLKSVSFLDTTTGEAFFFNVKDDSRRNRLLSSLGPVEVVVGQGATGSTRAALESVGSKAIVSEHASLFEIRQPWPESALRLLAYAVHMQGEKILETLAPFEMRELLDRMELPSTVVRHLEIFETYKGETKGTLFHSIDRTKTSSGARMLKSWLQFPLASSEAIARRLDRVEAWTKAGESMKLVRQALGGLGDVERRLGKLGSPSCNPRDVVCLAESLEAGLEVTRIARDRSLGTTWDPALIETAEEVVRKIRETLVAEPPVQLKNGGLVRQGHLRELDELIELSTNSNELIMQLEVREREATGIPSLKIRFNNVFGYYIEITNTHKDKVPTDRYDRKQTLANAERYLTKELAELESKVLSAQSKRLELETAIFGKLVASCLQDGQKLLKLARMWAEVDVVSSLAWLALEQNFVRPTISGDGALRLKSSRHPVIEQALPMPFVANDIELPRRGCLLLTGPNMAGKSTLMRQVAVAAILAQTGSFVPASQAELPLYDRIFTRIGASDYLAEGLSTFMVEMKETAEMLECATEDSLVILDEVGRGTSTYDGMSLAQSILEFLLDSKKCMTLFATHYHELTELAQGYPQLFNVHMRIHEKAGAHGPEITFMHQLAKGPANKSYGIHVAKLAGLPGSVTKRASGILKKLEGGRRIETEQMSLLGHLDGSHAGQAPQETEIPEELKQALDELKGLDVTQLTPLEALNRIAKWQRNLS